MLYKGTMTTTQTTMTLPNGHRISLRPFERTYRVRPHDGAPAATYRAEWAHDGDLWRADLVKVGAGVNGDVDLVLAEDVDAEELEEAIRICTAHPMRTKRRIINKLTY